MQNGKSDIAETVFCVLQTCKKQKKHTRIQVPFMHAGGKSENGQDDKGSQKEIFMRILVETQIEQEGKEHGQQNSDHSPGFNVEEEDGTVLGDPVQAKQAPEIISIYGGIRVGRKGVRILREHLADAKGKCGQECEKGSARQFAEIQQ